MGKKTGMLTKKETYLLQVQDLMAVIPASTVNKIVDQIDDTRSIKWVVDGYTVHSSLRDVYSVNMDDTERFEFFLKARDYKKFVEACEARRKELFNARKQNTK